MNTKKKMTTTRLALTLALLLPAGLIQAATPPELVNFEGVLRDASGVPETGTKDMEFLFYDTDGGATCPAVGGTLLLTDSHLFAGTGDVTITGGLFNVELGGGAITAGSQASLSDVFRDNAAVYVEVKVTTETLCPRIHVTSAGYSMNSDHLDGVDSSGYIDTSATAQTKAGDLSLGGDITVNGGEIFLPGGATFGALSAGGGYFLTNDLDTDDLFLFAGNSLDDGSLIVRGDDAMEFRAGNGLFNFRNGDAGGTITAVLGATGNLQIDGDLTVSGGDLLSLTNLALSGDLTVSGGDVDLNAATGHVFLNNGASTVAGPYIRGNSNSVSLLAGDSNFDDLALRGGNSFDDGEIVIYGDNRMDLRAGNGNFSFLDGSTGGEIADLSAGGNLQIDGDMTVTGGDVDLNATEGFLFLNSGASTNAGPFIRGNTSSVLIQAGADNTDDLFLRGGNSIGDGRIVIRGDSLIELRAGNGNFSFLNGSTGAEKADLSSTGALQLDSFWETDLDMDLLDATVAFISGSPADFTFGGSNLNLNLGDNFFDDVLIPGGLFVTGTKSFIQNHPQREDLSIAYVALEGAEAATFARGSGRLDGGVARVALEETFAWTTNPEIGLTAHVTPRGELADL